MIVNENHFRLGVVGNVNNFRLGQAPVHRREDRPETRGAVQYLEIAVGILAQIGDARAVFQAKRGEPVPTRLPTELELLRLFLQHPRTVLSRTRIFERVWGYELDDDSKLIEVYVRYLREKLEADGEPRLIHTVRGAGYILREDA